MFLVFLGVSWKFFLLDFIIVKWRAFECFHAVALIECNLMITYFRSWLMSLGSIWYNTHLSKVLDNCKRDSWWIPFQSRIFWSTVTSRNIYVSHINIKQCKWFWRPILSLKRAFQKSCGDFPITFLKTQWFFFFFFHLATYDYIYFYLEVNVTLRSWGRISVWYYTVLLVFHPLLTVIFGFISPLIGTSSSLGSWTIQ